MQIPLENVSFSACPKMTGPMSLLGGKRGGSWGGASASWKPFQKATKTRTASCRYPRVANHPLSFLRGRSLFKRRLQAVSPDEHVLIYLMNIRDKTIHPSGHLFDQWHV